MQTTTRKPYPRKALTPYQQLQAAIKNAQANNVHVIGHGTMKADGAAFWIVPSQSVEGMCHVVKKASNDTLSCDCYYSVNKGRVCAHRAAVYLLLKDHPMQPEKPTMPRPPVKTMAQRAAEALPYTDNAPFSIYKTSERRPRDQAAEAESYTPRDYASHQYR